MIVLLFHFVLFHLNFYVSFAFHETETILHFSSLSVVTFGLSQSPPCFLLKNWHPRICVFDLLKLLLSLFQSFPPHISVHNCTPQIVKKKLLILYCELKKHVQMPVSVKIAVSYTAEQSTKVLNPVLPSLTCPSWGLLLIHTGMSWFLTVVYYCLLFFWARIPWQNVVVLTWYANTVGAIQVLCKAFSLGIWPPPPPPW